MKGIPMSERYKSEPPTPSQPPVPVSDLLRVESQPPVESTSFPEIEGISDPPASIEINRSAQAPRYPFTKGVSLRNDGVGYGEVIIEAFGCFAAGAFVVASQRSLRTRTSRTFPAVTNGNAARAVPPGDVNSLASVAPKVPSRSVPRAAKLPSDV
jgi:hypothetical protein